MRSIKILKYSNVAMQGFSYPWKMISVLECPNSIPTCWLQLNEAFPCLFQADDYKSTVYLHHKLQQVLCFVGSS